MRAQRAVLLPAVRSNASVAAAAENGTKVATAYPGRVALQARPARRGGPLLPGR